MKRIIYTLACLLLSVGAWAEGEVAQIGETKYATLAEAVAAVTDGQTITLINDVVLSAECKIGESANVNARKVTIDFGGHTVSSTANKIFTVYDEVTFCNGKIDFSGYGMSSWAISSYGNIIIDGIDIADKKNNAGYIVCARANATVTLKSGTIESNKPRSVVYVAKDGNFVMDGGKLVSNYNTASSSAACVNVAAGGTATINAGELEGAMLAVWVDGEAKITGGKFTSQHVVWVNKGTANISGGEFYADPEAVYLYTATAKANISGGYFEATGSNKDYLLNIYDSVRDGAKFNVTGGTYKDFNPFDNKAEGTGTNFVDEAYETVQDAEGNYILQKSYTAKIGDTKYATLADAVTAAQNGEIVTLLANTTENIEIPAGKDITLDLNGKTLSGGSVASNGKKAAIVNKGTTTIQDSSAEQTGTIKREDDDTDLSASNSYYVIDNQGTMTIKSGSVTNKAGVPDAHNGSSLIRNGEVAEGAVLNIEGGTLTQNNFDVIQNGGKNSVLNITGGTINSANSYAILSYDKVNMSAGSVTGKVCLRSYDSDYAVANISGGTINGNITVETYPDNTPTNLSECNISGTAVINGTLSIGEGNGKTFTPNDEKGTIAVSGGAFNNAVPEQYCAEGFMPQDKGDGTYGVTEKDYVAKIGDKKYESLAEAIEAAQNGETVTLLADATINEMITIADGKAVTVDMNGKNISGSSYFQVTHGKLNLTGEGVYSTSAIYALKVVGATTDQGADYSVISVDENVTVKSSHATYGYVAMVSYDTSVMGNKASYGAKIDFNGKGEGRLGLYVNGTIQATTGNVPEVIVGSTATIKSEEYALYAAGYANYTINGKLEGEGGIEAKGGKVVVNEGAVITATSTEQSHEKNGDGTSTKGYAIVSVKNSGYAGNAIEVKGGTITGKILSLDDQSGDEIATGLEVSGGTFDAPVPEKYCADGFIPTDDGEGHYGVKNGAYVAQIGDVKYETLSAAVSAATEGQTIKLIAAVNEAVTNSNTNSFTINLNGNTWTSDATSTFRNDGGVVTITDTDASGKGTVQNTANENDKGIAVWARTGSVVIKSGTFVSQSNYEATLYVGTSATNLGDKTPTITVDGGTIKNEAEGKYAHNSALLPLTLNIINNIANADTYQAIVVNGGTFFGNDPSVGDDSQLNKINNNSNFVAPNLHAEKVNGVFVIKTGGYVAQTGYIKYVTLDDAIDARPESATTIYLLADAETTKDKLPANITIDARNYELTMPSFVVLDGEAFTLPNITGADTYKVRTATYKRTNVSSTVWGTVCLPFSLTSGNGATYYTFKKISGSTLTVDEATSVDPHTPVVFSKTASDLEINETDATVSLVTPETLSSDDLVGTYESTSIDANGSIYFINGDTFHKAQVSVKVPMYRAYINYTASGAKPDVLNLNVIGIGNADGIESVVMDATNTAEAIYDVNGRQLTAPQKGLNIMKLANGKTVKVAVK